MAILFTFGVADSGNAKVKPDARGQMKLLVDGSCNVLGQINLGAIQAIPLLLYGPNAEQPPLQLPGRPSLIFNQISDADSHTTALQRCAKLCALMPDVPVINHPDKVMMTTREQVAESLQGIRGVKMPRTVRCSPSSPEDVFHTIALESLRWPVIMRVAGDHNARSSELLDGPSDAHRINRFALDGRDYYLTEYVDSRDDRGLFSKNRLVFVGGEVMVRHADFGETWLINSSSRPFMKAHPELGNPVDTTRHLETMLLPKAADALNQIAERIGLDYFGLDCHINADGEVLVFEANANMNMLIETHDGLLDDRRAKVRSAIEHLLERRSGEKLS